LRALEDRVEEPDAQPHRHFLGVSVPFAHGIRLLSRVEKIFDKRIPSKTSIPNPHHRGAGDPHVDEPEAKSESASSMSRSETDTDPGRSHDTFIFRSGDHLGGDLPFVAVPMPDFIETRRISPIRRWPLMTRRSKKSSPEGPISFSASVSPAPVSSRSRASWIEKENRLNCWWRSNRKTLAAEIIWMRQSRLKDFLADFPIANPEADLFISAVLQGGRGAQECASSHGEVHAKASRPSAEFEARTRISMRINTAQQLVDHAGRSQETSVCRFPSSRSTMQTSAGVFPRQDDGLACATSERVTMASVPQASHSDLLVGPVSSPSPIHQCNAERSPGQHEALAALCCPTLRKRLKSWPIFHSVRARCSTHHVFGMLGSASRSGFPTSSLRRYVPGKIIKTQSLHITLHCGALPWCAAPGGLNILPLCCGEAWYPSHTRRREERTKCPLALCGLLAAKTRRPPPTCKTQSQAGRRPILSYCSTRVACSATAFRTDP